MRRKTVGETMSSIRIAAIALLISIATACGMEGSGPGGPGMDGKGDKKPDPVTVVEIDAATLGSVADVLASSATVESESQADIIPVSTGIAVSVHKDEGDPVQKGDLLAVLDNVSLGASAERAASDLQRLEEQYREMERLASQGAVSNRELSDLRYQLEAAKTSKREASRSYGQTRLTAPFDGVVSMRNIRVGELATSSGAAFQVVDLDRLRVVASMPERDLPRIEVGQPATLISAYDPDITAKGTVERIAPVVDAGSGTFRVTVRVDPDQTALRPGQFVTVDLEVDRREDVVVVPRKAIVYEDGSPVVYVYGEPSEEELAEDDPDGKGEKGGSKMPEWLTDLFGGGDDEKAEDDGDSEEEAAEDVGHVARRTPVDLGLLDNEVAEITSGLDEGDQVIVVGQSHLRDGAKVRDVNEPADDEAPSEDDKAEAAADEDDEDDGDQG